MPPPVDNPAIPDPGAHPGERIAKLLARAGVASRREIERMIADGRVALRGVVIDTPATVLPSLDGVTVDGLGVAKPEPARLFLYHKPTGLLVTEHDPRGRPTIYDRLHKHLPRLVPVGRLDLNTEGLLLLTTDGELKRQLELPASGVERSYRARAYGPVTQAQLEELIEGVEIEGVRYGAIDANLERRTGANSWIELTLTEGKNREVRRVLEHLGLQVGRLIRTRYGPFILADLPPGEIGEVRPADLVAFRQSLATKAKNDARIAIPTMPKEATSRRPARGAGGALAPRATSRPAHAARPKPHPGAGRGQVVENAENASAARPHPARPTVQRTRPPTPGSPAPTGKPYKWRGAAPTTNVPKLDPGLRRGGGGDVGGSASHPHPSALRASSLSHREREGAAKPRKGEGEGKIAGEVGMVQPRPAKPQRKTGWAKPKPKSGPARPRKPCA